MAEFTDEREYRKGLTISIEPSWRDRFRIACHNKSLIDGHTVYPSAVLRPFIIKKTLELEEYVQTHTKKLTQKGEKRNGPKAV